MQQVILPIPVGYEVVGVVLRKCSAPPPRDDDREVIETTGEEVPDNIVQLPARAA